MQPPGGCSRGETPAKVRRPVKAVAEVTVASQPQPRVQAAAQAAMSARVASQPEPELKPEPSPGSRAETQSQPPAQAEAERASAQQRWCSQPHAPVQLEAEGAEASLRSGRHSEPRAEIPPGEPRSASRAPRPEERQLQAPWQGASSGPAEEAAASASSTAGPDRARAVGA